MGGVVDAAAILATIIGIGVTIGYGVNQLTFGMHQITDWDWLVTNEKPTLTALSLAVISLTMAAMLSALSGIGRGIRWLSNLNMALSWLLLFIFIIFGATAFAGEMFIAGLAEYLGAIPAMSVTVWNGGNTKPRKHSATGNPPGQFSIGLGGSRLRLLLDYFSRASLKAAPSENT